MKIHVGAASSGHYVSIIKNWKNNEWYLFDDIMVSNVSDQIQYWFGLKKRLSVSSGPSLVGPKLVGGPPIGINVPPPPFTNFTSGPPLSSSVSAPPVIIPISSPSTESLSQRPDLNNSSLKSLISSLDMEPFKNAYTLLYRDCNIVFTS